MKYAGLSFVALVFFVVPAFVHADYTVTGAGTAGVDGCYVLDLNYGGSPYFQYTQEGTYVNRLVYSGYYELRTNPIPWVAPATSDDGRYYDSLGTYGSYIGMDTVNGGANPVPTITEGCAPPPPPPAAATSTPYVSTQQEQLFIFGLFLFLVSVPFWSMVFSLTKNSSSV